MHHNVRAAPFTIVNIWKQPKCLSAGEWIKKCVYIHNEVIVSQKKNGILPFEVT